MAIGYIGAALHKVFVFSMYEVGYMMGMDVMTPVTNGTMVLSSFSLARCIGWYDKCY
jgi:hypothetical protein